MGISYEKMYEIHYYECDKNLNCTLESIMNFLGDVGNKHAESLNVGMEYLTERNLTWVFYKYNIKINRYPKYEEKIKVKTVAEEFKKFYALRTNEIYDENNIKIVEGSALFLLIDIVKRRAVKITDDQYKAYNVDKGSTGKNLIGRLERLEKVKNNEYVSNFKVRYSDIDFNKHVNNVKYVQWFMDSVPQEIREEYELKEIDILFEHECYYNDEIKCVCEIHKNEDNLLVLSNIQDKDGKELTVFVSKWE